MSYHAVIREAGPGWTDGNQPCSKRESPTTWDS
jgi:hypothetical protein